jgi:AcrR family transcriptional regulator
MAKRTAHEEQKSCGVKPVRGRASAATAAASTERNSGELQKRSALLWDSQPRPRRGPKPALGREDVVQAAISVADEGDLAALTMQAVAQRLGFTTMALYRYFPNKEALVDAAVDAAMGTPPHRRGPREGWRQEVKHWAYAKRAMLCSRPWLAELPFVAAPHGPNWLSWHEAFLRTITAAGLSPEDMMDVLSVIHGYVSGSSDTAISLARAQSRGITIEQWAQAVGADLCRAIDDPRYPILSAILTSKSGGISQASPLPARAGRPRTLDESFDFGLERVLDGIERYIAGTKSIVTA